MRSPPRNKSKARPLTLRSRPIRFGSRSRIRFPFAGDGSFLQHYPATDWYRDSPAAYRGYRSEAPALFNGRRPTFRKRTGKCCFRFSGTVQKSLFITSHTNSVYREARSSATHHALFFRAPGQLQPGHTARRLLFAHRAQHVNQLGIQPLRMSDGVRQVLRAQQAF